MIRQDEADRGERDDRLITAELEELRRLRKENTELRRANEIFEKLGLERQIASPSSLHGTPARRT